MARVKAGTSKASAAQRRLKFIEAYIANGGNGTQAAIAAGFSEKRARATGAELVADRNIWDAIAQRRAQIMAETQHDTKLSIQRTLQELARIAFFDVRRVYRPDGTLKPINEWDDDTAAVVSAFEVEGNTLKRIRQWDKNAALDKVMKYFGLYRGEDPDVPPAIQPERMGELEIARRIMFVLEMGARQRGNKPAPKAAIAAPPAVQRQRKVA